MSTNPFWVLQQHKNFRLFWFGQTLSLVGSWMQTMAQGWLALELSNSPLVVGVVAAASSLPIVLLSIAAGVVVDRSDKLRLVTVAQTMLLLEATALWWLTWTGRVTIGGIVGPSLAALVIAGAGIAWCFAVNALSYLAVLVGLLLIRLPPRPS